MFKSRFAMVVVVALVALSADRAPAEASRLAQPAKRANRTKTVKKMPLGEGRWVSPNGTVPHRLTPDSPMWRLLQVTQIGQSGQGRMVASSQ